MGDRGRTQRAQRRRRQIGTSARIVCGVLAVAVLVGSGWAWASYRSFAAKIVRIDAIPPIPTPGRSTSAAHKDLDGKDQNILIVGNDSRDGATPAELADLGPPRTPARRTPTP
jgi:hypothetical protein